MKKPEKGDVFLVSLDPTIGTEINKTRPGLIVSNNVANKTVPELSLLLSHQTYLRFSHSMFISMN